jgi:dTDP-4-amino-4,6-dideoxygalactose transaminase
LPIIPDYATNNAHIFYLVCKNIEKRTELINRLKENGILAVSHYLSLHKSLFYETKHDGRELPNCDRYADCLLRLPMFYEIDEKDIKIINKLIIGNPPSKY